MPLTFRKEPPEVTDAVKIGIARMSNYKAFRTPKLRSATMQGAHAPTPEQAIPVYNIGLTQLSEGKNLTSAEQKTWRYIVKQSGQVMASADVAIDPQGKQALSQVNEGPLVSGTVKALEVANANEKVKNGRYEARILMAPAIYVAALWLVDTSGKDDLVIPFEPTSPILQTNKLYSASEFISILQKAAKESIPPIRSGKPALG